MTPFGLLVAAEVKRLGYTEVDESRSGEGDMMYAARGAGLPSLRVAVSCKEISMNGGEQARALAEHRVYNGYRTANAVGGMA
jgi:hypothetical protein